jgi:hypothetical protein
MRLGGNLRATVVRLSLVMGLVAPFLDARADKVGGEHQLSVYVRTGLAAYLSDARTIGGIGGGLGIRDTVRERFILQADVNYLAYIGNTVGLNVGAGLQRSGMYSPAVLLTASALLGDQLSFLSSEHPRPPRHPAFSLGLSVAPVRFSVKGMQLSLFELGAGVGTDLPGLGLSYRLGLLEVGASW